MKGKYTVYRYIVDKTTDVYENITRVGDLCGNSLKLIHESGGVFYIPLSGNTSSVKVIRESDVLPE